MNRYVGFGQESSFGTEQEDTVYDIQVASASLDVPDDPNIVLPTLARFQEGHIPGYYSPAGNIEFPIDVCTAGFFMKWGLGEYVYTGDGGEEGDHNLHELYVTQDWELPSSTVRVGKDNFEHVFLGCVVNTIGLSVSDELAMLDVGFQAQRDKSVDLRSIDSLNRPASDLYPMAFYDVKLELGDENISSDVQSFSMDLNIM